MSAERPASELTVAILPIGGVSPWQIVYTAIVLRAEFGVKTLILPGIEIPGACFETEIGQYRQDDLLDFLFQQIPANSQRIMGIVTDRLGSPVKKKASHGIAHPYDGMAVYREPCSAEYGEWVEKNQKDKDFFSRHLIIHEFCHTLGIGHCDKEECAMHTVSYCEYLCDDCQRWANRELQVKPGSAEERFARAESLHRRDQTDRAIIAYRQAIANAPTEPLYYQGLSAALYKPEQYDERKKSLARSVAFANDFPHFYYNFGLKNLRDNPVLAEDYFYKAIASAKDQQKMQRLVGQAYRQVLYDVERASRHYKEYLRLGGNDPDVLEWMVSRGQIITN